MSRLGLVSLLFFTAVAGLIRPSITSPPKQNRSQTPIQTERKPVRTEVRSSSPVRIGWPDMVVTRKMLVVGRPDSRLVVRLTAKVSNVPRNGSFEAMAFVVVSRTTGDRSFSVIQSTPRRLGRGQSTWRAVVSLNANDLEGRPMESGSYLLEPLLVVGDPRIVRRGYKEVVRQLVFSKPVPTCCDGGQTAGNTGDGRRTT